MNNQAVPNPQLNLGLSIAFPVLAVIVAAVLYFTKPVPPPMAAPAPVNTTASKLPVPNVVFENALPSAGAFKDMPGGDGGQGGGAGLGGPGGGKRGAAGGFGAD